MDQRSGILSPAEVEVNKRLIRQQKREATKRLEEANRKMGTSPSEAFHEKRLTASARLQQNVRIGKITTMDGEFVDRIPLDVIGTLNKQNLIALLYLYLLGIRTPGQFQRMNSENTPPKVLKNRNHHVLAYFGLVENSEAFEGTEPDQWRITPLGQSFVAEGTTQPEAIRLQRRLPEQKDRKVLETDGSLKFCDLIPEALQTSLRREWAL